MIWRHPDEIRYEKQKGLKLIRPQSADFGVAPVPVPPALAHNPGLTERWKLFYGLRLATATEGKLLPFRGTFPGHTLPGEGDTIRYRGSLELERFLHLSRELKGFFEAPACSQIRLEPLPKNQWPWKIREPKLVLVQPEPLENGGCPVLDLKRLEEETTKARNPFALLAAVHQAWNSGSPVRPRQRFLAAASWVLDHCRKGQANVALAFELEACIFRMQASEFLNIRRWGYFEDSWVETGSLPLSQIQLTELAVPSRVVTELLNMREGFAPIVINELYCDTDGTHRALAAHCWNFLRGHARQGGLLSLKSLGKSLQGLQSAAPLVRRETLRVLYELLDHPDHEIVLRQEIVPRLRHFRAIKRLPVLLLPEYAAGTVIKGPYDAGKGVYRVHPHIYRLLAANHAACLPARGPYHLTDRNLLPWIQVLHPAS